MKKKMRNCAFRGLWRGDEQEWGRWKEDERRGDDDDDDKSMCIDYTASRRTFCVISSFQTANGFYWLNIMEREREREKRWWKYNRGNCSSL